MCEDLAEALSRCRIQGTGGLSPDELAELIEHLDELEGVVRDIDLTEAGLAEIARAIAELGEGEDADLLSLVQGEFAEGVAIRRGGGTGGPGRGQGPRNADKDGRSAMQKTRVKNKAAKKGPIIASWYFKGQQVKGKAQRELKQVVQAARDRAADAISENRIPRRYEASVKKYFGRLKEIGEQP